MNRFRVDGFVGKDSEQKVLSNGMAVTSFSVADTYKPKNGEPETEWYSIEVYGDKAERASRVKKGNLVMVEGRLVLKKGKDGRTFPTVYANEVYTLTYEKKEQEGPYVAKMKTEAPMVTAAFNPAELSDIPF